MMFVALKTIAWDEGRKGFYSPQQTGFYWPASAVVAAKCSHITEPGDVSRACHCGIYASPNTNILTEYEVYPNSIVVLLNLYGTVRGMFGPKDKPETFVLRAWGARIIGIVEEKPQNIQRYMSTLLEAQQFRVPIQKLVDVEEMILANWNKEQVPYIPIRRK